MIELDAPQLSRFFREVLQCGPLVRVHEGHKGPFEVGWPTEPRRAPLDWESRLEGWPAHLLFLPTGELLDGSWLVVVDADLYKEGAEDSLVELHALGLPRRCPTALTPSGGEHRYYRAREPLQSGPLAGFPGIDVKCIGGGVRVYEYEYGYGLLDEPAPFLDSEPLLEVLRTIGGGSPRVEAGDNPRSREPTLADELAVEVLVKHAGAHSARWTGRGYVLTRPGKEHGISCTVGIIEAGVVHVFSSSWPGVPAGTYSLDELCRMLGVPSPMVERFRELAASIPTLAPALAVMAGAHVLTFDAVEPLPIEWLWPWRIARGCLTMLEGDPSIGKSTLAISIAAKVSSGGIFPDGSGARPGDVLLLSAEDSPERVVVKRLKAAGANLGRVHALVGEFVPNGSHELVERPITLPEGIPLLEAVVREKGIALVVVDVLAAYESIRGNADRDAAIRSELLAPLAAMAERTGCAVILIRHFTKSHGSNPLYAGGGSIAKTAAARSLFIVAPHPEIEGLRVLAHAKSNYGMLTPSLSFTLEASEEHECARVEWHGECELGAHSLLSSPLRGSEDEGADGADEQVREVLETYGGEMPSKDLEVWAELGGISRRRLFAARKRLGLIATQRADGKGRNYWIVSLPDTEQPSVSGAPDTQGSGTEG